MPFVRYKNAGAVGDWREIVHVYETQALANAATTVGNAAYTGDVSDNDVESGWWVNTSNGNIARTPPKDPPAYKAAALKLYQVGLQLEDVAAAEAVGHSSDAHSIFHDFLFHVREYHYLVMHSAAYTDDQKAAWATEMLRGPADLRVTQAGPQGLVDVVRRFYGRVTASSNPLAAPTAPFSWVNPSTGAAVNIDPGVTISGTIPATVNLSTGEWIEALPNG